MSGKLRVSFHFPQKFLVNEMRFDPQNHSVSVVPKLSNGANGLVGYVLIERDGQPDAAREIRVSAKTGRLTFRNPNKDDQNDEDEEVEGEEAEEV